MKTLLLFILASAAAAGANVTHRNGVAISPSSVIDVTGSDLALRGFGAVNGLSTVYDTDASSFFTRVGTNGGSIAVTEQVAVNRFVISAKGHSYWTALVRINVFVGADLAAALTPLKVGGGNDPETNVNFVSGDYGSATGLAGNGSSKYLDTGISATTFTVNSSHLAVYNRSGSATANSFGALDGSGRVLLHPPWSDGNVYSDHYNGGTGRMSAAVSAPYGLLVGTRIASNDHQIYKQGTSLATSTGSGAGTLPSLNVYVFALNDSGSPAGYSAFTLGAYSLGTGLTSTQVANYSTDMERLQDDLGRGVH